MPARYCPQCAQEVSSTARFCPNCAARLEVAAPPSAGSGEATVLPTSPRLPRPPAEAAARDAAVLEAAASKSRKLLIPALLAALAVLVIAVAVLAAQTRHQASLLVSQTPAPVSGPAVTNAPALPPVAAPPLTGAPTAPVSTGAPLTGAPTQPPLSGPGVTNAPNAPAPSLPPDVAAYLAFLQGIEQRRVAMNNDVSGATAMLGLAQGLSAGGGLAGLESDPEGDQEGAKRDAAKETTRKISAGYGDYALKWQGLVRDFRATPPPPACTALAARYQTFLGDYTTIISKMQVALLNHNSSGLPDLSAVAGVQGQVNADGATADTALGDLCSGYGVPKPFVIAPEGAAPSLLGH